MLTHLAAKSLRPPPPRGGAVSSGGSSSWCSNVDRQRFHPSVHLICLPEKCCKQKILFLYGACFKQSLHMACLILWWFGGMTWPWLLKLIKTSHCFMFIYPKPHVLDSFPHHRFQQWHFKFPCPRKFYSCSNTGKKSRNHFCHVAATNVICWVTQDAQLYASFLLWAPMKFVIFWVQEISVEQRHLVRFNGELTQKAPDSHNLSTPGIMCTWHHITSLFFSTWCDV